MRIVVGSLAVLFARALDLRVDARRGVAVGSAPAGEALFLRRERGAVRALLAAGDAGERKDAPRSCAW